MKIFRSDSAAAAGARVSRGRLPGLVLGSSATIVLSFAAQWLILTRLGATRVTDSYFAALAVPMVMLYVISDPLNRVALPTLSVQQDARDFWAYAWTTIQLTLLIFVVVALLLYASAPGWIPLLVPGFSGEATRESISLTRLLLAGMIFQSGGMAARAVWNAKGHFVWPSAAGVIGVFSSLLLLFLMLDKHGIIAAAWAFDVRFATEAVLLIGTLGSFARPRWKLAAPYLRKSRPLILGAAYFRTDVLVDRVLTSLAPPGGLSLLYLAQQLLSAVGQVINQSVVAPTIPFLAKLAHAGEWQVFGRTARIAIRNLLIIATLILLGLFLFGEPALSLVFAHRSVGSGDVHRLLLLMLALGGMLVADSAAYFAYSSFYAIGDTTTPTVATAIVYSMGIATKIGAFLLAGVVGLALGISGYYVTNALVLLYLLRRTLLPRKAAEPTGSPPLLGTEGPVPVTTNVESF